MSTSDCRVVPLADAAVLVDCPDGEIVERLTGWAVGRAGIEDVVPTLRSVTLVVDPDGIDVRALIDQVRLAVQEEGDRGSAVDVDAADPGRPVTTAGPPTLDIPVRFDGPDLDAAGRYAGLDADGVVAALLHATLTVGFLGFSPGFAYLVGLPPALAAVPRRDRPRPRVPAGSVALAGGFAAVYPQASPGGWHLLGTTDLALFDPHHPPYSRLQRGQQVRFVVAGGPGQRTAPAAPGRRRPLASDARRAVEVEAPGLATTVQDGGRAGMADLGVPRAGPADLLAHRLANRLVGNSDGGAALEVTMQGPTLVFRSAGFAAVVGDVPVTLDGRPAPTGAPLPVAGGHRLQVGACRAGARAVVAVAGGVLAPVVAGARASDTLSGLGLGPLVAGDVLPLGTPGRPAGRLAPATRAVGPLAGWAALAGLPTGHVPGGPPTAPVTVRVVPGPDATDEVVAGLAATEWTVHPDSNRVGARLAPAGPAVTPECRPASAPDDLAVATGRSATDPGSSRGVVTGVVQLPPGGEPVVLLCDHATVGGYPIVATVVSVDVALVAQLRPGARLRLQPVTIDDAVAARRSAMGLLDRLVLGRYPTTAG